MKIFISIIILLLNACSCKSGQPIKKHIVKQNKSIALSKPKTLTDPGGKITFIDNNTLVNSSAFAIKLWNIKTGKLLKKLNINAASIDVSPDKKYLLLGLKGKSALLNIKTGRILRYFYGLWDWVETCRFHPSGNIIASGDDKGKVILWNIKKNKRLAIYSLPNQAQSLQFSKNGELLYMSTVGKGKNVIQCEHIKSKKKVFLKYFKGPISSLSIIIKKDQPLLGNTLYYRSQQFPYFHNTVHIRNANTMNTKLTFKSKHEVTNIAFHPNKDIFAIGDSDGGFKILDLKKGTILFTYHTNYNKKNEMARVQDICFSDDGSKLAVSAMNRILIWELQQNLIK